MRKFNQELQPSEDADQKQSFSFSLCNFAVQVCVQLENSLNTSDLIFRNLSREVCLFGILMPGVLMRESHFINLIFGDINNRAEAVSLLPFFFDISDRSTRSHLADVSNEMHFSLRVKIMLSLCDRSCASSTKCARGVSPFGNSVGFLLLPPEGSPPCQPCALHPSP